MSKQYVTPAPNQPSQRASDFFDEITKAKGDEIAHLDYLHWRWMDEKEFEDINDYQKPLNPIAEKFGVKITKMHKRPFGFTFEVDGRTYRVKSTGRNHSYQRTA